MELYGREEEDGSDFDPHITLYQNQFFIRFKTKPHKKERGIAACILSVTQFLLTLMETKDEDK